MDNENQLHLINYYKEQSDEQIRECIRLGREGFEKEAFDIIRNEARRRRLDTEPPGHAGIEKPLEKMTRDEIIGLFLSAQTMEPDSYNALCAEAFRRNISRAEIDHFQREIIKAQSKHHREDHTTEDSTSGNPLPLIIFENLDDATPYGNRLGRP